MHTAVANTATRAKSSGLEGTVVADSELSEVDGEQGRLILRGFSVEELGLSATLEDAAELLWSGRRPGAADGRMQQAFGAARARAFSLVPLLGPALALPDAMASLRAAVAHVAEDESELGPALAGAVAVFAAAWARRAEGREPIAPDPSLSHAADYLRMLQGGKPSAPAERALSSYLVTVADHGMNASTFAARVVASTGSDAVSAIVAGIGALKGPLHGGAPGPVLDMLDAIGAPERAAGWLEAELAAGRRIMGMGHRVYRVRDPRAAVLERAIEELERAGATASRRLPLARAVERAAVEVLAARYPERALKTNVEFYTAVLLDALGVDRRSFSATFAVGRVVGWYAHVEEQRRSGRLIRPASRYVGPGSATQ
ncbi:MAG TPA: citrate synthase [Polyangiaceae bacterium]|nr:citrate synthase [Polyangiaceae bacterium]